MPPPASLFVSDSNDLGFYSMEEVEGGREGGRPQCARGLRPLPDRHRVLQWFLHASQIGNSIFQMEQ